MTKALFLIGFGGPENAAEIRPFLDSVLRGRPVTDERYEEVVRQYETVGGKSPYNALTASLAGRLGASGLPVYVGLRHAAPSLQDALQRMAAEGITAAAGVILASFRSEPSWDRYVKAVETAAAAVPGAPAVHYLAPWNDDALFIRALCDRVREAEAALSADDRADAHWLFTAHSIPMAADHASRYAEQIRRASIRVAEEMRHANWSLCFQSRSGRPEDPWLEPDVCESIANLSVNRSRNVMVIPIGFLVDHVEVLFDLDVKARGAAKAAGLTYHRAPTVGEHPSFLELINLRAAHALNGGAR